MESGQSVTVDRDLLDRARHPHIVLGRGVVTSAIPRGTRYALLSQPGPRRALGKDLVDRACVSIDVTGLDELGLEEVARSVPAVDLLVGAGGGVAIDTAKFVAWRRGLPFILVPTIVSVDASVTNTVAIRRGGRVVYEGFVVPEVVVVDFEVIRTAPRRLNRAGVGDILSAHTALRDWWLAAGRGRATWDAKVAESAGRVLDRVDSSSGEILAVSDQGIELLVSAYAEMNDLCLQVGHSQPEEGSEHYFAYLAERVVGRSFVHGEIVGLGTVLMAGAQENQPERVCSVLQRCGVEWRASHLGISATELAQILGALPKFVQETGLPYSIIDEIAGAGDTTELARRVDLAGV